MTKQNAFRVATLALALALPSGLMARGDDPEQVKRLKETKQCDGCNFQDMKLGSIDARVASLKNADFRGALLYNANFKGADLTGALFGGADLSAANLSQTKGANLTGAKTTEETTCPNGTAGC